jgi:hypothetical protein
MSKFHYLLFSQVWWSTEIHKLQIFEVYNLVSFDICIHLWRHHHNQDNERPSPPKISSCPFVSCYTSSRYLSSDNHYLSDNTYLYAFSTMFINTIMCCILFVWYLIPIIIIILRFIHIDACVNTPFLFITWLVLQLSPLHIKKKTQNKQLVYNYTVEVLLSARASVPCVW